LRAFIGVQGVQVFVRGYTAPIDGGQGAFFWSPTATGDDNGDTIIQPAGVTTGRWLRIPVLPLVLVSFDFLGGTPPGINETMGIAAFPMPVTFYPNFTNPLGTAQASGWIRIPPDSDLVVTCNKQPGGTTVGTMTIATDGTFSFATTGAQSFAFDAGDSMVWQAPGTAVGSAADMGWTVVGALQP
jgi:hypothetical protein